MHRAVMSATEWDRKLIADLAAERTRLGEPEVVGVRGPAAAHETRLLGDKLNEVGGEVLRLSLDVFGSTLFNHDGAIG
jgi:hypothetical protein